MYKHPEENFSEDARENLHIENEILKLKMQAESNAIIVTEKDLPPEIENMFLRNVQEWEDAYRNVKQVKIFDLIERPDYRPASEIKEEELQYELDRLVGILNKHQICLHVDGRYDSMTIYRFITEEFFDYETDDMQMPGLTQNFTYEEFHPNHELDIQRRTLDFLEDWFQRKFDTYSWELDEVFVLPDGRKFSKEEVLGKIGRVFESYSGFNTVKFALGETSFQFNEADGKGLGHCHGVVKYKAVMENGEVIPLQGPFTMYMSYASNWWNIFYFVFPGFTW